MGGSHRRLLYLGLTPPEAKPGVEIVHTPLIAIKPFDCDGPDILKAYSALPQATHLLFTSKNGVTLFFSALRYFGLEPLSLLTLPVVAVGRATAAKVSGYGPFETIVAQEEHAEGVAALIKRMSFNAPPTFFWSRSALSRRYLRDFFLESQIRCIDCPMYDTVINLEAPVVDLTRFDEVVFTSPSTVDAFFCLYGNDLPEYLQFRPIGPVTEKILYRQYAHRNKPLPECRRR